MAGNAPAFPKNNNGGRLVTSYNFQARQGQQTNLLQKTSKKSFVDKQTGNYSRATNKEVVTSGETFKERSTGRVGCKDEYKTTSTYRFGNKGGYREYQREDRYRVVNFEGSKSTQNNNSGGTYSDNHNNNGKEYSVSNKNYDGGSSSKYGNKSDGYNNEGQSGFRGYIPSFQDTEHNQYDDKEVYEDGDEEDHQAVSSGGEYDDEEDHQAVSSGEYDDEEDHQAVSSGGEYDDEEYEDDLNNFDGGESDDYGYDFDDSDFDDDD